RGYNNYAWFAALDRDSVFFVTRMKDNTDYGVVDAAPCPRAAPSGATRSSFSTNWPAKADPICSCVASRSGTRKRTLVFLTNHRSFAASTIAAIYQSRWQIELFFKALKQNLRIKTFVGTSPNALQIQIWT